MLTEALPTAATAHRKQMIQGSAVRPPYDAQDSFAPSDHNAVIDNAAGTLACAAIPNVRGQKARKLRLLIAGAAPRADESHSAFASDCSGRACREGAFDVHEPAD